MVSTPNEMVERARKAMDRVDVELKDYKGSCGNCKYLRRSLSDSICVHPVVTTGSLLQDQGYSRDASRIADYQRGKRKTYGEIFCGPNGFLFEQKETFVSWWGKFKQLFG